ncbi:ATP-binding protein [Defluviitalea phaphyphila]|uniref:ATP-binding protein n=1 Tax=Defluviitalea phaphyphila TaxID=1473580 RepID=UPI00073104DD|nr:4Fe-4S binding protein [Defluviitalea phaphyphila]
MLRKIIQIEEEKCNGCGLCVEACHEGAIELVDGKAKLISDEYCDGLGDCLPKCPTNAIKIIERESKPYNEELVKKKMTEKGKNNHANISFTCPGMMAKTIEREKKQFKNKVETKIEIQSELMQWPVQLKLINPSAEYLNNSNWLIAADCTPFAYANFHQDFIKDHITMIGCPKLDDNKYYTQKITEMLIKHNPKSITVVRMEVPCCGGIVSAVKKAMLEAEKIINYREIIITTRGEIL